MFGGNDRYAGCDLLDVVLLQAYMRWVRYVLLSFGAWDDLRRSSSEESGGAVSQDSWLYH